MEKVPFILKQLSINKMPGFPKGMEAYKDLSPGINIVAGPNASGKSSTARMIQKMIWRENISGIHGVSSVEIGGEAWQINLDSGDVKIQREGKDDHLAGLPAAQAESRYMLALHELVKESEQELAQQIVQESIGGYDLDEAAQSLNYNKGIRNRSASEYVNFKKADDHYRNVKKQQQALQKDEEKLKLLYKDKEKAQHASRLKDLYEQVIAYLKAKQDFDHYREQYEAYPAVMEKVNGEELTTIGDRENEIQKAEKAIEAAKKKIDQSKRELSALDLPEGGMDEKILNELDERIAELEETDREIGKKEEGISESETKVHEAVKHIDESLDPENWKGIDLKNIHNLENFLLEAHQTISEKQFLETRISELKKEIESNSEADSDVLKNGMRALTYWLQEKKSFSGISVRWIWILSAVAGVTAILTHLTGWPGLLGLVVMGVVAIYAYQLKPTGEENVRKQDFVRTGLIPPAEWNVEKVSERLEELIGELNVAKLRENLRQRMKELGKELDGAQKRLDDIKKRYDEWIGKLKALPVLPEKDQRNYSGLYAFLTVLKNWQEAHTELESLKNRKKELDTTYLGILEHINTLFDESYASQAKDTGEAKAILKKLKNQEAKRSRNVDAIETQEEIIKDKEENKEKNIEKLKNVYSKLEVAYGDNERVRQLVEQLDDYRKAKESYQLAEHTLRDIKNKMKEHSLYEDHKEETEKISLDQARELYSHYDNEAGRLDDINKEITTIETNIANAKQGNDLEKALMEREERLSQLEGLYQSNLASLTGKLIVEQIKQETQEQNRPAVFRRANELFNRITSGRYELMVDERNEASFRAYDTVLKLGQELGELSTGTRIQLLLSVRLAFIESQESSLKLPVLADELLANSDDARAKAIIDALVEISREGRQIFYFTAQGYEVAKWESYLSSVDDISYKTIPLTGKRHESVDLRSEPDFASFRLEQFHVPSPEGKKHDEYGKALEVPAFNLLTDEIEQLHLWYLLEDSQLLYNCLKIGLQYWGQLDSYLRNGGLLEGLEDRWINKLRDKVKLLSRFQELYRLGRAIPIDRSVLEQSGAVSDKFIDAVNDELIRLNGNPQKLLQSLKNGRIQGFRKNKIAELEQYFLDEGYIDEQPVLKKEDILVQMNALLSNMDMDITEAEKFIERVLAS